MRKFNQKGNKAAFLNLVNPVVGDTITIENGLVLKVVKSDKPKPYRFRIINLNVTKKSL